MQPRGLHTVGTTVGFRVEIVEALAPQSSLPQRTKVPAVAYEHLFRLPFRGCSYYHTPPPRAPNGRVGATIGVKYLSTVGRRLRPKLSDTIDCL
jgi:hypothetical protein